VLDVLPPLVFREDGGMKRFRACFEDLVDPRTGNAQRHDLLEVLLIALLATLCGAEGCVDMALFGRAKAPLLRRFLRLEGGIPSHDTFSRIFRLLDPDAFEASFGRFVAAFAQEAGAGEVVAVDGKAARRSFDRQGGRRPLHLVSAWAVEQRLVLGQRRVDGDSNEIEALPELLALLALDGHIVTADAMHCQKATARTILDRGGDYCLALKGNQPALYEDVRLWLDDPATRIDDACQTVDGDHGRIETRRAWVRGQQQLPARDAYSRRASTSSRSSSPTTYTKRTSTIGTYTSKRSQSAR
jgi:hypothetical protein